MNYKLWTNEELETLRKFYGKIPNKELASKFPDRTQGAIVLKAQKCALSKTYLSWTAQEDKILTELASNKTSTKDILKYLPQRTPSSIEYRINYLNLGRMKHWSEEEDKKLKEIYSTTPTEDLAKYFPNRTSGAILSRAVILKLSKEGHWTPKEEELLSSLYNTIPITKIHKEYLPNKTISAIKNKTHALNLRWSKEETNLLRKIYRERSPEEIKNLYLPYKPLQAIKNKIAKIEK